jgi:hypothetical protein
MKPQPMGVSLDDAGNALISQPRVPAKSTVVHLLETTLIRELSEDDDIADAVKNAISDYMKASGKPI